MTTQKEHVQTLGQVLDNLISELGWTTKLRQYSIVELWPEIVGTRIADIAHVEKIDQGILVISVTAAPWRAELTFRKKEILQRVHEALGEATIRDIRFR